MLPLVKKLEQMQEIGRIVGRYLFPILLIAVGLFLVISSNGQTQWFRLGGISILIVGLLSFLFVKGYINRTVQIIATLVVAMLAIFIGFLDYSVIDERLSYDKEKKIREDHIVQRLKDIRKAQLAYHKEYGYYTPSFDTLLDFLNNGQVSLIKRLGSLPDTIPNEDVARELGLIHQMPDSLTEEEVIASGMIVRDTILVPVDTYVYDESDANSRKYKLYIDSLPYVPFTDHKFKMETATIESGGVPQSTFLVEDPKPFADKLAVGSLEKASTAGNWRE